MDSTSILCRSLTGLFLLLLQTRLKALFDQLTHDIAQPYAEGQRKGHDDTAEYNQEADCDDCIANAYHLEDNAEGNDKQEYPHTLRYGIAILQVGVLARQVYDPADKIAQYDSDDDDDDGDDDEGQGSRNTGSIFGKLGYADKIQAKGKKDNNEYPVDDLAQHKGREGLHATLLQKTDDTHFVRPLVKSKKNQKPRQELFYEPAYDETHDQDDNHPDDA